jgi:hypothetical protein
MPPNIDCFVICTEQTPSIPRLLDFYTQKKVGLLAQTNGLTKFFGSRGEAGKAPLK